MAFVNTSKNFEAGFLDVMIALNRGSHGHGRLTVDIRKSQGYKKISRASGESVAPGAAVLDGVKSDVRAQLGSAQPAHVVAR